MRGTAAWIVAIAIASAGVRAASADGFYYSEALGSTQIDDALGAYMSRAFRIRAAVGIRSGRWAIEPFIAGVIDGLAPESGPPPTAARATGTGGPAGVGRAPTRDSGLTMWGVDLKYYAPIAPRLEGYVHGSMSSARADGALDGYAGRGLGGGAGIQLEGRVRALGFLAWPLFFTQWGPKVAASLWLDTSYEMYRLHGPGSSPGPSIDGQLTHVTFGFSIGSDL